MGKLWKRWLSGLLSAVVLITSLPAGVSAQMKADDSSKPVRIATAEKGTIEVEDSWEETYPYGAFLFSDSDVELTEAGDAETVTLYRLGGTRGRATAFVVYAPMVATLKGEAAAYGTAAGNDAVDIEVEDELPIAKYQPLGKDPDPDPSDSRILMNDYSGEDSQEGDRILTLDGSAESYQWYILAEGRWQAVEDAADSTFIVAGDMYDKYDFRLVFTEGGKSYCTDSVKGKAYVKPEEEILPRQPEDLDINPEQTFSKLETDSDDPYSVRVFAVTFAEGEWEKDIRVTVPDNDKADPLRFGTFTIVDNNGGDIYRDASTVTMKVTDDDTDAPYTIGFEESEIKADKSSGIATVKLKRNGGGQDPITVDYETMDGTAKAGTDYKSVSGTAVFFADVDEVTVEIPLINDGNRTDDPLDFSLVLGELKGDERGLCTLKDKKAGISLVNTVTGAPAVSVLTPYAGSDEDSFIDEGPVTGVQEITPEEDLLYGTIAGFDDPESLPASGKGEGEGLDQASTYNYGKITFSGNGGNYWSDRAYIAGNPQNDITGWKNGSAYGNGWQIKSDDTATASMQIDHMPQKYKNFSGNFEFKAGLDNGWHFKNGWAWGWAQLKGGNETAVTVSSNPSFSTSGFLGIKRHLKWTTGGSINKSWDINSGFDTVSLEISKHENKSDDDVYSRITSGYLERRVFEKDLMLRIHTANDGEGGNGNVITAPPDGAALTEKSGVYESMRPEVIIDEHNGGIDSSSRLYVGSKIRLSLKNTDSYKPYSGKELNAAVYVTRASGDLVNAKVEPGQNGTYYVTMLWDGMKSEDLTDTYTLNIVMTRSQEIELNLSPSVDRKTNRDGTSSDEIDLDKIGAAWDDFWKNGKDYISVGCSEALSNAPHFDSNRVQEVQIKKSDWKSGDKNPLKILGTFENIQYINFNRSKGDRITFNGKLFNGDEKINMSVAGLAFKKISFGYYNSSFLSVGSTMHASVSRVELYFDGDGDGKISGHYDPNTGYFVLDKETKDTFQHYMDENSSYDEVSFQPEKLSDGKYGEYFAKIFYTMTPRSLVVPPKGGGTAQVLPAFTTSRTDEEKRSELTEEQNSYRYIMPGIGRDSNDKEIRTSDNHPMYGAEATAFQFVDVPLGGDRSPLVEKEKDVYEWKPEYSGNLIYPFSNPEPVFIEHSLAGDNYPLAEINKTQNGDISISDEGKSNLNGYLGSFVADTTIALCVTEQNMTADELKADQSTSISLKPESSCLCKRSAAPNGAWLSQMKSSGMGEAGFNTSDSGQKYSEFNLNYDMDVPASNESFQGLATVVTGKNTIQILLSIPLADFSSTNGAKTKGHTFPQTITDPMGKSSDQIKAYGDGLKTGSYDKILEALQNGGYKQAESGRLKSSKFSGSIAFSAIFTLKYDTKSNVWYFQEFVFGAAGSLAFKYSVRLAVCPLVYGYIAINASINITTGGTVVRNAKEGDKPFVTAENPRVLNKNDSMTVPTAFVNMYIMFNGRVYVETLDAEKAENPSEGTNRGYLNSNGGDKIQLQLKSVKSSMSFDNEKTTKYVRITALKDTTITYLNTIESIESYITWSGVRISPKIVAEIGVGAGVEGLKVEAFIKIVASANFVFGQPQGDGTRKGAAVESASFSLSLALRAVLLMMSWEIDAVGIKAAYDGKAGKWTTSYTVLGKDHPLSATSSPGESLSGNIMSLPRDVSRTQTVYSTQYEKPSALEGESSGELDPAMAYEAEDPNVPFQLSGYNSSVEAVRLADGLDLGYDYKVVTVKDENYVVYTLGRPNGKGMDTTMLVVSRLVMSGEGYGQNEGGTGEESGNGLGLVNPLDWDMVKDEDNNEHKVVKSPDKRSKTPYILVDLKKEGTGLVDDGTGDLGFDVSVFGNEIRVAWVSYAKKTEKPSSDKRKAFQDAAKNTVIKQASYDVTKDTGFGAAEILSSEGGGSNVYLPTIVDEHHTAFVRANHVDDEKRKTIVDKYIAKQNKLGYSGNSSDAASRDIYNYRMTSFENNLDLKGDSSVLCVYSRYKEDNAKGHVSEFTTLGGSETGYASDEEIKPIDKLGGLKETESADEFVLAYSVWNEDIDEDSPDGQHDSGLYVSYMKLKDSKTEPVVICPRGQFYVSSNSLDAHAYIDTMQSTLTDPFTSEKKDDTLIVGQGSRISLLSWKNTYDIYSKGKAYSGDPLEETHFYGSKEENRSGFEFGLDGGGDLSMVYISTVKNTTNTGLYLSRYDKATSTWGYGTLLAMRHMDVNEDSAKYAWSDEDAEKAYLGELKDYSDSDAGRGKGGFDQFQFANPQIALGEKGQDPRKSSEEGKAESTDVTNESTTLTIVTQGTMRYLKADTKEGQRFITVGKKPDGAKFKEGLGIYAISYGVGHQSIGHGKLSFLNEQFSAGSVLDANLSFVNTGDVTIRGSKDNPISVILSVDGGGIGSTKLATWKITENIATGRETALSGCFTLPVTLPEGAGFTVTVCEDKAYTEDPYSASLKHIYTINKVKELGFRESSIKLSRQDNGKLTVDQRGNVILDVDLFIGNYGTGDAVDAYIQFAYGVHDPALASKVKEIKGEDSDWNDIIYHPLDINGNTLVVGEEEQLSALLSTGSDQLEGLSAGVLGIGSIRSGYGRRIKGTISVSPEDFLFFGKDGVTDKSGSLRLAVEVFSDTDSIKIDDFSVHQSDHNEYNGANNRTETTISNMTSFMVPRMLEIPAGMRFRLPIVFSTTLGSREPLISAVELTDCEDTDKNKKTFKQNMDQTLDTVSYEAGYYKNGHGNGTLIIRGAKEGNSYIRIQDSKTNSYQDVAIIFTEPGDSLDIWQMNGIFTFQDESGKEYKGGDEKNGIWVFQENVSSYGKKKEKPYNGNLAKGKPGASFTFTTEAEKICLYFSGEVTVSSDFEGFSAVNVTDEDDKKMISFGSNPENKPHNVTVTVTKAGSNGYAEFDKLTEYFYGDNTDTNQKVQERAATLMWDGHFPEPGSLEAGQAFDATLYVVINTPSDSGEVSCNYYLEGKNVSKQTWEKTSDRHYTCKVRFTGNGETTLRVRDQTGYSSAVNLDVNWWKNDGLTTASPAFEYYQKKFSSLPLAGADRNIDEILDNNWLHTEWDGQKNVIKVSVDNDAPSESFAVSASSFDSYLDDPGSYGSDPKATVSRGKSAEISVSENALYLISAKAVKQKGTNEAYNYTVSRDNGQEHVFNAEDMYYSNRDIISTMREPVQKNNIDRAVTQTLSNNRLSFDSITGGSVLYLLKGGKYTYEDGITVDSLVKGAVKMVPKKHILKVNKDSLIMIKRGYEAKTMLLKVVKPKKKTVVLNSRDKIFSLDELFTGVGEMLPDVQDGKYSVSVKDPKGIIVWKVIPVPGKNYCTLGNFVFGSTGKKGSAVIAVTFGGRTYKATVKCGGYPVLKDSLSENLVQRLPDNRLTFDSVSDKDTLLLLKKGVYTLEDGVTLEPVGAEYKGAVKVVENKKTGTRTLKLKKEAPVRLTKTVETGSGKQTQEKIVLFNYVTIRKKTVTLKNYKDPVNLSALFTGAYELLPDDADGYDYEGYAIRVDDRDEVLAIWYNEFPAVEDNVTTTLENFRMTHYGRKGKATISLTFGGKTFKATVKCK